MNKYLFITDASVKKGLGHLTRQLAIAGVLKNDSSICFCCNSVLCRKIIEQYDYHSFICKTNKEILSSIDKIRPSKIIIDRYNNPSISFIRSIKKRNIKIISMDNNGSSRFFCDSVINPTISEEKLSHETECNFFLGPKYAIIRDEFKPFSIRKKSISENIKKIFICFGGSDDQNITSHVLNLFSTIREDSFDLNIVTGNNYPFSRQLIQEASLIKNHNINIFKDPENFPELIFKSDIGIISFGNLFYEVSALGLPSLIVNPTDFHTEMTDLMLNEFSDNLCINCRTWNNLTVDILRQKIKLLESFDDRKIISSIQKSYFDVDGLDRITEIIRTV